ncbi:MAG: glutathione S-transferase family protein [Acidiferrobacterales bacterium]|nr:glutathione S-transferase family protein [Acidiferrobacterales bacterium]
MSKAYKLYGTPFSLYSGKVRSYLLKKGLTFEEVLSTVKVYREFIKPRTGVSYIPVIHTPDDRVIQDTSVIIDALENQHPMPSIYPESPKQRLVSLLLECYGDEWLVIPAMHYRWNFPDQNQPYVFQNFGLVVAPNAPSFIRAWLGKKLGSRFKDMLPSLGINQTTIPAIEQSFQELLSDLDKHFEKHDFLLGGRPSIGDFGLIGPLYAHLYLDPYPSQLIRKMAPAVCRWIERMISAEPSSGSFIEDGEIPESLFPILKKMVSEQIPVLLDTDKKLAAWLEINQNKPLPRSIGKHQFKIQDTVDERNLMPYSLWMFQRPHGYYQGLSNEEQAEIKPLLTNLGFLDILERPLQNRLTRVNNRLVLR